MSERLVDVQPDELREDDEVVITTVRRGKWCIHIANSPGLQGPGQHDTTYQRVEGPPDPPTTPGAVQ